MSEQEIDLISALEAKLQSVSTKEIYVRWGLGAFFAVMFFSVIVFYQLRPAAEAQQALTQDRSRLMDAVTVSLKRSDASGEAMSEAVKGTNAAVKGLNTAVQMLNVTMRSIEVSQQQTHTLMREFTKAVQTEHKVAQDSLDRIEENTEPDDGQ